MPGNINLTASLNMYDNQPFVFMHNKWVTNKDMNYSLVKVNGFHFLTCLFSITKGRKKKASQ